MPANTQKMKKLPVDVSGDFEKVAEIIRLFPEAKPSFAAPVRRTSQEQLEIQQKMLAEALKNAPVLTGSKGVQNQIVFEPSEDHKAQAAKQENNGSIFSSAFFHIAP